jgi:hypothetical protein
VSDQKPPRTEIWLRKIHAPYAENRSLTTIFRPGRRLLSEQHPKALEVGEDIRIRVVVEVGADWAGLYGTLLDTPNIPAIITSVTVKKLADVAAADFSGSTPDAMNYDALKLQLALIYNLSQQDMAADFWITRTTFRYRDS